MGIFEQLANKQIEDNVEKIKEIVIRELNKDEVFRNNLKEALKK